MRRYVRLAACRLCIHPYPTTGLRAVCIRCHLFHAFFFNMDKGRPLRYVSQSLRAHFRRDLHSGGARAILCNQRVEPVLTQCRHNPVTLAARAQLAALPKASALWEVQKAKKIQVVLLGQRECAISTLDILGATKASLAFWLRSLHFVEKMMGSSCK